jgi:hypothetical protein
MKLKMYEDLPSPTCLRDRPGYWKAGANEPEDELGIERNEQYLWYETRKVRQIKKNAVKIYGKLESVT